MPALTDHQSAIKQTESALQRTRRTAEPPEWVARNAPFCPCCFTRSFSSCTRSSACLAISCLVDMLSSRHMHKSTSRSPLPLEMGL